MRAAGVAPDPEALPYFVGTLSLRSFRQAFRGVLCCIAAVGLWSILVLGLIHSAWDKPLTWLISGLFGGIAVLFTIATFGFARGFVTGGVFEQVIDKNGVRAWNPFRNYSVPRAAVAGISPSRRFLSERVDVCVMIRSWGRSVQPLQLWTDDGITLEAFEDLRQELVSRGFR